MKADSWNLAARWCAGLLIVCLSACTAETAEQRGKPPAKPQESRQESGDRTGGDPKDSEPNTTSGENMAASSDGLEKATFGGGCFWCVEAVFLELKGVKSVRSGYMGGTFDNPTYEHICTGMTGHAEVVQIEFDPSAISYDKLLEVFFLTHDPTTLNRQGNDRGTQYRSVVFWHTEQQKETAESIKKKLEEEKVFNSPIVTEITQADKFWVAEDYHQNFFARNPGQPYCEAIIPEKIRKVRKVFADHLREGQDR
jgi:peptide-methionine (S)-S-oxide reductase